MQPGEGAVEGNAADTASLSARDGGAAEPKQLCLAVAAGSSGDVTAGSQPASTAKRSYVPQHLGDCVLLSPASLATNAEPLATPLPALKPKHTCLSLSHHKSRLGCTPATNHTPDRQPTIDSLFSASRAPVTQPWASVNVRLEMLHLLRTLARDSPDLDATLSAPRANAYLQRAARIREGCFANLDVDDEAKALPDRPVTVAMLVHAGLLRPGPRHLRVKHKQHYYYADLGTDGTITYPGCALHPRKTIAAPSAFAKYIRNTSSDGWQSVYYRDESYLPNAHSQLDNFRHKFRCNRRRQHRLAWEQDMQGSGEAPASTPLCQAVPARDPAVASQLSAPAATPQPAVCSSDRAPAPTAAPTASLDGAGPSAMQTSGTNPRCMPEHMPSIDAQEQGFLGAQPSPHPTSMQSPAQPQPGLPSSAAKLRRMATVLQQRVASLRSPDDATGAAARLQQAAAERLKRHAVHSLRDTRMRLPLEAPAGPAEPAEHAECLPPLPCSVQQDAAEPKSLWHVCSQGNFPSTSPGVQSELPPEPQPQLPNAAPEVVDLSNPSHDDHNIIPDSEPTDDFSSFLVQLPGQSSPKLDAGRSMGDAAAGHLADLRMASGAAALPAHEPAVADHVLHAHAHSSDWVTVSSPNTAGPIQVAHAPALETRRLSECMQRQDACDTIHPKRKVPDSSATAPCKRARLRPAAKPAQPLASRRYSQVAGYGSQPYSNAPASRMCSAGIAGIAGIAQLVLPRSVPVGGAAALLAPGTVRHTGQAPLPVLDQSCAAGSDIGDMDDPDSMQSLQSAHSLASSPELTAGQLFQSDISDRSESSGSGYLPRRRSKACSTSGRATYIILSDTSVDSAEDGDQQCTEGRSDGGAVSAVSWAAHAVPAQLQSPQQRASYTDVDDDASGSQPVRWITSNMWATKGSQAILDNIAVALAEKGKRRQKTKTRLKLEGEPRNTLTGIRIMSGLEVLTGPKELETVCDRIADYLDGPRQVHPALEIQQITDPEHPVVKAMGDASCCPVYGMFAAEQGTLTPYQVVGEYVGEALTDWEHERGVLCDGKGMQGILKSVYSYEVSAESWSKFGLRPRDLIIDSLRMRSATALINDYRCKDTAGPYARRRQNVAFVEVLDCRTDRPEPHVLVINIAPIPCGEEVLTDYGPAFWDVLDRAREYEQKVQAAEKRAQDADEQRRRTEAKLAAEANAHAQTQQALQRAAELAAAYKEEVEQLQRELAAKRGKVR